ncbi:uncharacterized protein LOC128554876 [Mercenaria mercenaria]|uniref:uncharacterized protein LOC128554876 n=1 Tax=Mercenaria mercenaria TaxID=6596 RepID=UPI00234F5772|nr:uncharacterized protein LOC128554876 [Mercenaria mercenaria]
MYAEAMREHIKYFAVLGTSIILVFTVHYVKHDLKSSVLPTVVGNLSDIERLLLGQRNNLSKLLNIKQQEIGQQECQRRKTTSENGGWCEKQSKEKGGKHMTDRQLVPTLIQFLKGKYIGSFGDGPGRYKQLFIESGEVKGYDAYDGSPFCDVTSDGRVKFLDLTLPQYGLPLYDWVLSFEVAEHIPRRFESVYIDNIVRHAREGVVLSWAKVGQGGYSHINNRPFEYVRDIMESLGFIHDNKASEILKSNEFPLPTSHKLENGLYDINIRAICGTMANGGRASDLNEQLRIMDIPSMRDGTFSVLED